MQRDEFTEKKVHSHNSQSTRRTPNHKEILKYETEKLKMPWQKKPADRKSVFNKGRVFT